MLNKIIRIGRGKCGDVYCSIKFDGKRLSISGVEGPKSNGNAIGSCGQIIMSDFGILEYATGWSPELENEFRAIWEKWHLNDMQAGSPSQSKWIDENPLDTKYPKSHFTVYSEALSSAGLNPDPNYIHNGKPYKFGSSWLHVDVPVGVISFLSDLPDTDKKPAWV